MGNLTWKNMKPNYFDKGSWGGLLYKYCDSLQADLRNAHEKLGVLNRKHGLDLPKMPVDFLNALDKMLAEQMRETLRDGVGQVTSTLDMLVELKDPDFKDRLKGAIDRIWDLAQGVNDVLDISIDAGDTVRETTQPRMRKLIDVCPDIALVPLKLALDISPDWHDEGKLQQVEGLVRDLPDKLGKECDWMLSEDGWEFRDRVAKTKRIAQGLAKIFAIGVAHLPRDASINGGVAGFSAGTEIAAHPARWPLTWAGNIFEFAATACDKFLAKHDRCVFYQTYENSKNCAP